MRLARLAAVGSETCNESATSLYRLCACTTPLRIVSHRDVESRHLSSRAVSLSNERFELIQRFVVWRPRPRYLNLRHAKMCVR